MPELLCLMRIVFRESNEKLARDNMAMGASLDKFVEIRDMLEKSDNELRILREKFVQLQAEHGEKVFF